VRLKSKIQIAEELKVMKIVWTNGAATVRDAYQELLWRRKIACATVMSAL
jgi:predicted transcriptional regulator